MATLTGARPTGWNSDAYVFEHGDTACWRATMRAGVLLHAAVTHEPFFINTRAVGLRSYRGSFIGSQLVEWLINQRAAPRQDPPAPSPFCAG